MPDGDGHMNEQADNLPIFHSVMLHDPLAAVYMPARTHAPTHTRTPVARARVACARVARACALLEAHIGTLQAGELLELLETREPAARGGRGLHPAYARIHSHGQVARAHSH